MNKLKSNQYSLRSIAMLAMVFFLIVTILTALVIVPKINRVFESQNAHDIRVDLALEAELFTKYVESQKTILEDLANFPSLVNATMLSDSSDPILTDLFDNVVLGGEKGRLVLQDIGGTVLINNASDFQGIYGEGERWVDQIIDAAVPYHFQLLSQIDDQFTFKISVPVKYNELVEGVLSAEITESLEQVFVSQSFNNNIAFRLVQDEISIYTDSDHIEIAHEESIGLEQPDLTFIYITDAAVIRQKEISLRNTILLVLLTGLVVSFLLFVLYGYRTQYAPDKLEGGKFVLSRSYIIPILVAAIGSATSITAFLIIYFSQSAAIEKEVAIYGKEYVQNIQKNIDTNLENLYALASFYDASDVVDRQEFDTFTESFIANNRNIQALAWIPNVSSHERQAYKKQAELDGLENFEIKEITAENRLRLAGNRDQYFPVYYIAPMEGNEKVFGFDLASHGERLAALSKASRSRATVATAPIDLVEEERKQKGILVFYPVYSTGEAQSLPTGGEYSAVKGFVLLVLKANDILVDSMLDNSTIESVYVKDVTISDSHKVLYGNEIASAEITFSQSIDVAGRTWQVDTVANSIKSLAVWIPRLVLMSGLVFTIFMTIGLVHLIRRRELVEMLVEKRTAELKMLSSIVSRSNDIVMVTSANELDADKGGPEIIYVNDAFTRYTGYSFDEAVGNTPRILQGARTDRTQLELIRNALLQGKSYHGELINYTKENTEYWVDINIVPLTDETGEIIQYASVQRDITDRKQAHKERESLIDKLTDSNEELARFAFVCSHDLQEPLRMIRSFSEKLQTHIGDDLVNDEKGRKYFHFITDGATRAQELIEDILTYSSIDSDTQKLDSIDGNQLVSSIKDAMQVSLDNSGGVITSEVMPELYGNRTQLFQLFQNLLNNAIKYQRHDTSPHVHISVTDAGEHWQFAINDNGIGMEQRHLRKIFDVFQRLHRKNQYAGTGVGLSICKKVVKRHGGKLWVESEHGVGSTFYFTLLKPVTETTYYEPQRKAS